MGGKQLEPVPELIHRSIADHRAGTLTPRQLSAAVPLFELSLGMAPEHLRYQRRRALRAELAEVGPTSDLNVPMRVSSSAAA